MHALQLIRRYSSKHSLSSSTSSTVHYYYYYEAIQLCLGRRPRTPIIRLYLNLFSHGKISMKTIHGKISRQPGDLNVQGGVGLGGAVWILPVVANLSTRAFATDERGRARVLMHPPVRARCLSLPQTDQRHANYAIQPQSHTF